MFATRNGNWKSGRNSGIVKRRAHLREVTIMRNLRLARVLLIVALLVVPVAVVGADTGTVGNGYVWDGASDWPGVTSIVILGDLPQTGKSGGSSTAGNGYVWDGASDWPGVTSIVIPGDLPATDN